MKKIFLAITILSLSLNVFAQDDNDEEKSHKFRRDNIFIGGAIGLGASSGGFSLGANPEVGYTVANWLDAGISTNFNYYSLSAEYNYGMRQRSFNYGGGIFARAYPIRNIFIQVLPEYNWINTSLKDLSSGNIGNEYNIKQEAPSLLLGIGYATRDIGRSNFYTAIMFDAGTNTNSPYIGSLGSKQPIIRAGFNVYLRPKRN